MKIKLYYGYPKVTVKTRFKRPKRKVRGPGFMAAGQYLTRKHILKNKYLSRSEREILLDMCSGVTVKKSKRTKRLNKYVSPIAKYYIDGTVYRDGSIDEVSEFWGIKSW